MFSFTLAREPEPAGARVNSSHGSGRRRRTADSPRAADHAYIARLHGGGSAQRAKKRSSWSQRTRRLDSAGREHAGKIGLETCREIRDSGDVPIIMLTVRNTEHDKVQALDAGADDYVVKPFGTRNCWRGFARRCGARRRPKRSCRLLRTI